MKPVEQGTAWLSQAMEILTPEELFSPRRGVRGGVRAKPALGAIVKRGPTRQGSFERKRRKMQVPEVLPRSRCRVSLGDNRFAIPRGQHWPCYPAISVATSQTAGTPILKGYLGKRVTLILLGRKSPEFNSGTKIVFRLRGDWCVRRPSSNSAQRGDSFLSGRVRREQFQECASREWLHDVHVRHRG